MEWSGGPMLWDCGHPFPTESHLLASKEHEQIFGIILEWIRSNFPKTKLQPFTPQPAGERKEKNHQTMVNEQITIYNAALWV